MPLTPGDVHNVTFSKPPIGKRGYHEDEVDAFLDLVSTELARLINEINDLHSRIDQLNQRIRAHPTVPPAARPAPPTVDQHAQSTKVLGMAQEIADRLTSEAKAEADRMLNTVQTKTQQLLAEAQAKADSTISEASSRAQTMLEEARSRADSLDRQSREKASAWEREAARKHTEILGGISQEKIALENRIDELRAFEREYRTRLKIYLSAQLRELDNRAPHASSDISHNGYKVPEQPRQPTAERLKDVDPYIVAS